MQIISKADALQQGLSVYFDGRPCKHGHISQRKTRKNNECLECASIRQAIHYRANTNTIRAKVSSYRAANPDKVKTWNRQKWERLTTDEKAAELERLSEWGSANSDRRNEAERSASRLRRVNNPEHFSQKKARSHIRNRLKNNERNRKWKRENPERVAVANRKRRAQQAGAPGHHTADDIADIKKLQKGRCAYCPASIAKGCHVDHITALVNGGSNDRRNLQILCQPCNNQKHAADPIVFARRRGMLL